MNQDEEKTLCTVSEEEFEAYEELADESNSPAVQLAFEMFAD